MKKLLLVIALSGSGCYIAGPDADAQGFNSSAPTRVQGQTPEGGWAYVRVDAKGNLVSAGPDADGGLADAFGRGRVSEPLTLFDSKQLHDAQPLFWDDQEVSGSGTGSSHDPDTAMTTISVSATTAGKRVRQTFMRFNYQPGKSQLIFMTGVVSTSGGGTGITRAMGVFDDNDGIFFRDNEGTVEACIRTSTSGSAVDNCVSQASWNLDKLDGSGLSGKTLDATKSQISVTDFEWLGVGRVRVGFVIDGEVIYVHEFNHANIDPLVYMSTPNLPLRYMIENDGTGAASSLGHICSTVISEGGQQNTGTLRYASTSGTHVDANAADTLYALIGMRLKTTHLDAVVDLVSASVVNEQSQDFEWVICWNPTVAGTFTYSDATNSAVQVATGATANTVTNCTGIDGGFVKSGNNAGDVLAGLQNAKRLGAAIDGTRDTIVLAGRPLGSNADLQASMTRRELQ